MERPLVRGIRAGQRARSHRGKRELDNWSTFRLGLFGLDKLSDVDGTVNRLAESLDHALRL